MLNENYLVREADKSEMISIISFISEHYIPETVVMNGFLNKNKNRITEKDTKEIFEKMQKNVYSSVCLVAVDCKDNSIVGTVILLPVVRADLGKVEKREGSGTLSLMQEFDRRLLDILNEVQLFEKYSERKKLANMRYLTTHKDHRGKGIAKALTREVIKLAEKYDFDLIYSFYTLPGSKKSAEGAGFTKVADYDLYTARDANGDSVFANLGSYHVTSIMALAVDK